MALGAQGVLLTWTEIPAELEAAYHAWYNDKHLGQRLAMPGFLRCRRYAAVEGGPRYLATYETRMVEDLISAPYLALIGRPDAEDSRIMGAFTTLERLTCRITFDQRRGIGGALGLLRFFPAPGAMVPLRRWLSDEALPALQHELGVLGAGLWENDLGIARGPARVPGLTFDAPNDSEWVVFVEGTDVEALRAALARHLSDRALAPRTGQKPVRSALYRLMVSLTRD